MVRKLLKPVSEGLIVAGLLALLFGQIYDVSATQGRQGVYLQFSGLINTHTANLINRGFEQAEANDAKLLVLSLNTPGGEFEATRQIVTEFLQSSIPSVVYVSPSGARAGSAGTFIAAAANFAVMAPGTNIGAATPVTLTGDDLPDTLDNKITNDAASLIRSIGQTRGRNVSRLEDMVRLGVAETALEALDSGVIDFVADDLTDLLEKLDGQVLTDDTERKVISTTNLVFDEVNMTILEKFLQFLANPTLAYFLLVLGGIGITLELFAPGMLFGGVFGSIFLLLSFLGLGSLPVNWAGVIFILLAFVLFIVEIQVVGFGVLGIGAIVSFLLGSFLLISGFFGDSVWHPTVDVNLIPIVIFLILVCVASGFYLYTLTKSAKIKYPQQSFDPKTGENLETREGLHHLVGRKGHAVTPLNPTGVVKIDSETWSACSNSKKSIVKGTVVTVFSVDGAVLNVDTSDSIV